MVTVREAYERDRNVWDEYVRHHSDATFFHQFAWRDVIEQGGRHQTFYYVAEEGGEIVGVLPLTFRKSALFGKILTSSMFAVYGGPLFNNQNTLQALDHTVRGLADQLGVDIVEYRSQRSSHNVAGDWYVEAAKSATFVKSIDLDAEARMLSIPRKQRAVLRKALDAGLILEETRDIDTFYRLYASSVHRLGTPVFPKRLFQTMMGVFKEQAEILLVRNADGVAVASLMNFYTADTVLPYYAGSNGANRASGAHDFMYWHTMGRAVEKGITKFDFGRSKIDSGPYRFKKNWGFEPMPLEYEYLLLNNAEKPDLSVQNSKYAMMSSLWKKLPLGVANMVGPYLARHLG